MQLHFVVCSIKDVGSLSDSLISPCRVVRCVSTEVSPVAVHLSVHLLITVVLTLKLHAVMLVRTQRSKEGGVSSHHLKSVPFM